ncbi:MAG: SAM-dependent DNA methyltransferase, partial [Nannocystaceae bacterium]
ADVCAVARDRFGAPAVVVEPSCGVGGFLVAAYHQFGSRSRLHGVELRRDYLAQAGQALTTAGSRGHTLLHANLFDVDWGAFLAQQSTPLLLLGNPPWVTNAAQGVTGSTNLPPKVRAWGAGGLAALTGESNFDISQWLVTRLLEAAAGREVGFALLLKVAVVRRLLVDAWKSQLPLRGLAIYKIDAQSQFQASVDACLFVGHCDRRGEPRCPIYEGLASTEASGVIGYAEGGLIADINAYAQTRHLLASAPEQPTWRSGIKHDCAKVFELRRVGEGFQNGLGEPVEVESAYLYPLLKSSDVARGRAPGQRWLIVPQRSVGESTAGLETAAPKLWKYL